MEKFGEDIAPLAVQMTQQLAAALWKYANTEDKEVRTMSVSEGIIMLLIGAWGRLHC